MKKKETLEERIKRIHKKILRENQEKYTIKRGGRIANWTSDGSNYVIIHDNLWTLYTKDGKQLTSGKILYDGDIAYIKKLSIE